MPLSRHQGVIAIVLEELWQSSNSVVQIPFVPWLAFLVVLHILGHRPQASDIYIRICQRRHIPFTEDSGYIRLSVPLSSIDLVGEQAEAA